MVAELVEKKSKNSPILITCKTFKSARLIFRLLKKSPEEVIMNEYRRLVLNFEVAELNEFDDGEGLTKVGDVYVLVLQNSTNGIATVLSDIEPEMIVVFDINLEVIRQIEAYKARRPSVPCHAVVLTYAGSVEDQQYLTVLNCEIKSFEKLVEEKDQLVKRPDLKVGENDDEKVESILVDTREFRSDLPAMIYSQNFKIIPAMLSIGDYVLSKSIAVERKSLTDLIGSLQNGRLYTQLISMKRYYSKPILLIEFEAGKPFALKALWVKTSQIRELMQKLVLTIIHFPSVCILWSPSSVMFGELKNYDTSGQPDLDEAQALKESKFYTIITFIKLS